MDEMPLKLILDCPKSDWSHALILARTAATQDSDRIAFITNDGSKFVVTRRDKSMTVKRLPTESEDPASPLTVGGA